MKLTRTLAAVATVLVGLLAGSALASTVRGTAGNDVLKGTPGADKLYGKGGNDKLFGYAGPDLLVGGPGADVLSCGPGKDVAQADANDTVRKDCETVKGLPAPPAEPPPTTPTPPPPPPPPAPVPQALTGKYCGFTNSGGGICFDVAGSGGSQVLTNAKFEQTTDCEPDARFKLAISFGGPVPLTSDLKFTYAVSAGELVGSSIQGLFDTNGNAAGSLVMKAVFDYQGTKYTCQSTTEWSAKKQV
jgi:RTX calcium-binding nonapeptide repeat (4 copies)